MRKPSLRRLPFVFPPVFPIASEENFWQAEIRYLGYNPALFRSKPETEMEYIRQRKFESMSYQYDHHIAKYFKQQSCQAASLNEKGKFSIPLQDWYDDFLEHEGQYLVDQKRGIPASFVHGDGIASFLIQHQRIREIFFKECSQRIANDPACLPTKMTELIRLAMAPNP